MHYATFLYNATHYYHFLHHQQKRLFYHLEAKPTIDIVKRMAKVLDTTVGYLLGETEDNDLFKDPTMLERLKQLSRLPEHDKACILYTLDGLLQNVQAKQAFAK
jgi:hypothetical protein